MGSFESVEAALADTAPALSVALKIRSCIVCTDLRPVPLWHGDSAHPKLTGKGVLTMTRVALSYCKVSWSRDELPAHRICMP